MTTNDQLLTRINSRSQFAEQELIKMYGDRYRRYREQYALAGRYEYEPDFPLYIMLEQTYMCNLRCPSCIQGMPERKKEFNLGTGVMPWELFERVILEGEKNNCPSLALHVNDEPLLVKDLPNRVAFAKKHGFMDIFMTTNGNLLNEDVMMQLVDAGVTQVLFSIDAASPEVYSTVRPGGDWGTVIKNMDALLAYRNSKGSHLPCIRASFVYSRLNSGERDKFVEIFSEKADYLDIQGFTAYYDTNLHLLPEGAGRVDDFKCLEPWRKLIVRANGDILPCCSFYGYEIVLGNLNGSSLREIFNSPPMVNLRREVKAGVYNHPPCRACSNSFYLSQ